MVALSHADLTRFFGALDRRLPCPGKIILTGGSEALLLGGQRPTGDIDFGLVVADRYTRFWSDIEAAIAAASVAARVVVQYSTDIDRWSSVAIPPHRFKTRRYQRLSRLTVHLLDPLCWAVYKLARYLETDITDLHAVLTCQQVSSFRLARLCGECLRTSPRSTQLFLFRRQVEHFFRTHGVQIWGAQFESIPVIAAFRQAAGIPPRASL